MKAFNESLRYEYELTPDSLIVDAGGFDGNWFIPMWEKHQCNIMVFEPVLDFWMKCTQRAYGVDRDAMFNLKIAVFQSALGAKDQPINVAVRGDSSGVYSDAETLERCREVDVNKFFGDKDWDVLKLNIEGMEFDVLERLVSTGNITRVKNIQVQFHRVVPDFDYRYGRLREALLTTHEPEWDSEIIWQNWKLK